MYSPRLDDPVQIVWLLQTSGFLYNVEKLETHCPSYVAEHILPSLQYWNYMDHEDLQYISQMYTFGFQPRVELDHRTDR